MRITIQALIDGVEGNEPRAETIGVVERDADGAPASGLGLFLREPHAVLRRLQAVVLREQVAQFVERASHCRRCGGRLATKDSKTVVYHTAFGRRAWAAHGCTPGAAAAAPRRVVQPAPARWPRPCPSERTRSGCDCKAAAPP